MDSEIEVQEEQIEAANRAEVLRHGDGCIILLGDKPFALDAEASVRLAWDLCVMFQDARSQSGRDSAASF